MHRFLSNILFLACITSETIAFVPFVSSTFEMQLPSPSTRTSGATGIDGCATRRYSSLEGNNDENSDSEIPCLPPIGGSSFTGEHVDELRPEQLRIGTEKIELQYTCNVCETRNSHKVSRMAYRNGIVITVCKGCESKHLIADNLGWTKYAGGFEEDNNIEEYMISHGRGDEVNRVTKEVFELEEIMHSRANVNMTLDETLLDKKNSFE